MESEPLTYIPEAPKPQDEVAMPTKSHFEKWRIMYCLGFLLFTLIILANKTFVPAPQNFPVDTVIVIDKGETLSGSASMLYKGDVIKSPFAFKVLMVLFGGTKGLQAGEYYLEKPEGSAKIAWRLTHGEFNLQNVKITIPEGLNAKEIALVFAKEKKFKYFNAKEFLRLAEKYEGYLFPDTYLFLPNITSEEIVDAMLATYKSRIESLAEEIKAFGKPIEDVIKMASILEEEGRLLETRRVIAGILWKRLAEKMPLQVDASVVYLTGKADGNKLAPDDFKIKSPYNTYLNLGLPPTPISNPGLDAIQAAVEPTKTKYYFYLTSPEGGFYPAATYDAHLVNKAKYLN